MGNYYALILAGFCLRVLVIAYGEWQDRSMTVKFTDVDYTVFSDAAKFVYNGGSPYERATYRYTPLLSWILVGNELFGGYFGKFIFVIFDIVVAISLLYLMEDERGKDDNVKCDNEKDDKGKVVSRNGILAISLLWLFNPMVFVISARGNAESIVSGLVMFSLMLLKRGKVIASAIVIGIAVHFKIYPILYCLPMVLSLSSPFWKVNRNQVGFFLASATTFLFLNALMMWCYGEKFLQETFLYHVTRKDHRHNFSVYFYHLYLTFQDESSFGIAWLSFLPQILLVGLYGLWLGGIRRNVPLACFMQTIAFVSFNKVCTSQYFLWYICFAPLVVKDINWSLRHALLAIGAWFASQAIWLKFAYELEFLGINTFREIWISSLLFFGVNVWIMGSLTDSIK